MSKPWQDFDRCEAIRVKRTPCKKEKCLNMMGVNGYAPLIYKGVERLVVCIEMPCGECKTEQLLPFAFANAGDAVTAVWHDFPLHEGKIKILVTHPSTVSRFLVD